MDMTRFMPEMTPSTPYQGEGAENVVGVVSKAFSIGHPSWKITVNVDFQAGLQ